MELIIKPNRAEVTGILAWSLFSFAAINISVQFYPYYMTPFFLSGILCCILASFFLTAVHQFKQSNDRLFIVTILYALLVVFFQILFESIITLSGEVLFGRNLFLVLYLTFGSFTSGLMIQYLLHAKN